MRSQAGTIEEYLNELPADKLKLIVFLRDLVLDNLPEGYVEAMNWGMICYETPMSISGPTYNGKPLMYAAIGAQKHHVALYMCGIYCQSRLKENFMTMAKQEVSRLDMGKSCLRIRKMEDIPVKAVAAAIAGLKPEQFAKGPATTASC